MRKTNSLKDEIHLQHQKIHDQSFSKKWEYFWHYYKVHTTVIIALACMFGSILHSIVIQKETVLSIAYINAFPNIEDETFIEDFENHLQLNPKRQQVLLDSAYYIDNNSTSPYAENYSHKFSTNVMAGTLDVVLADVTNFDYYGKQGVFQDLRTILSREELERYQEYLYYTDLSNDESEQKVPVGIKINHANKIYETSSYPNTDAYLGIVSGSKHISIALSYLYYLEN